MSWEVAFGEGASFPKQTARRESLVDQLLGDDRQVVEEGAFGSTASQKSMGLAQQVRVEK